MTATRSSSIGLRLHLVQDLLTESLDIQKLSVMLPVGVAVQGDEVYVADSANFRVTVFERNGTFLHGSTDERNGLVVANDIQYLEARYLSVNWESVYAMRR